MSRAESQARTRRLLVETARSMFLRDGYGATSLDRVADEAGFSKGAVYSNFTGKDDLCLAVLDSIHEEVAGAVLGSLEGAATVEEALRSFDSWAESRVGDPDWSALEAEFSARSRQDPRLRDALRQRNLRLRETIAAALTRTTKEHGIALPLPVDELATALLSIGIGIGVQRSLDHDIPVRVLSDVVRALAGLPVPHMTLVPESGPKA